MIEAHSSEIMKETSITCDFNSNLSNGMFDLNCKNLKFNTNLNNSRKDSSKSRNNKTKCDYYRMCHHRQPITSNRLRRILTRHQTNKMASSSSFSSYLRFPLLIAIFQVIIVASDTGRFFANAQTSLLNSLYLPSPSSSQSAGALQQLANAQADAIINKRDLTNKHSSNVCQVNDGESVAIVELEESRNSDMSQSTNPPELPISGLASEIELKIESETHKYFTIQNKRLKLTRPLDRDAILKENSTKEIAQQPITSIYLQISCQDKRQQQAEVAQQARKVIIPVLVKVLDVNDNAPKFSQQIYTVRIDELAPVGSIVIDSIQAIDLDSANNGQIEYSLVGPTTSSPEQPKSQLTSSPRLIQRAQPELPAIQVSQQQTTTITSTVLPITTTTFLSSSIATNMRENFTSSEDLVSPQMSTTMSTLSTEFNKRKPSSSATIDLDSEPIVNGPMEEAEEEEESDETLLAAMGAAGNSSSTTMDDVDSDGAVLMLQPNLGSVVLSPETSSEIKQTRNRKRRRRKRNSLTTMKQFLPTTTISSFSSSITNKEGPNWTNLLGPLANSAEIEHLNGNYQEQHIYQQPDANFADFFKLEISPNSNKPLIRLEKQLDYESRRVHVLHIKASDRASNPSDRRSSIAKIIIKVLDGDDQGPAFVLDQTGCATNSLPLLTTSSPMQSSFAKRQGELQADSSVASGEHLPKNFKVTEENFDFGDMSTGDEILPPEASQVVQANTRTRRYPEPATSSPQRFTTSTKSSLPDYSCLPTTFPSNNNNNNNGQAEYFASVMSGESDYLLRVVPQQIKARDRDELNAPIRYSFINGTPANFSYYFQVNPLDANIKQLAPVERINIDRFVIYVQAQEQTANKLTSVAKLMIEVLATDKNPPLLMPNSYAGFVEENSPIGSNVLLNPTNRSSFMKINILDDDDHNHHSVARKHLLSYEFDTTSEAFKVNKNGFVYVNKWPLDRDSPNSPVHMFQVTARQIGLASSRSISSPVSINVTLLDLNDNPPIIANNSLAPIYMPANNRLNSVKPLGSIRATDLDLADNARMRFSIHHVSNNGRERFRINPDSGEIEALGKFVANEQFSLTIQVTDELGRWAQGILEVFVIPGPNTGGPQFILQESSGHLQSSIITSRETVVEGDNSRGYAVEINENIAPHSGVIQVLAIDPENDPISYSIIDGNVNGDFNINSKTGLISTANKLDREEVSAYHLLVQARDTGGLATNRPVLITIADNNDENPTFEHQQYVFSVEEGVSNVTLGRIHASDNDLAENGHIKYELVSSSESPITSLFSIDSKTGDLILLAKLDYEQNKQHNLIVSARDHGENPRSTTASVLIKVIDVQDEAPYFERYLLEAKVPENKPNLRIAQVQAKDLDSTPQITYVMRSGDASLFQVDPITGIVSTLRGLDFEESRKHTIFVGTSEMELNVDLVLLSERLASQQLDRSPICRIEVIVLDVNDNAPLFVNQPLPVRIQDTAQLGTILARLQAEDRDGSEPNNQVRYELVTSENASSDGIKTSSSRLPMESSSLIDQQQQQDSSTVTSEKCAQSFMIDSSSGSISVKWDLKRDSQSECLLVIRAYDLSQNKETQLSSMTSLTVFIDHLVEISPGTSIGFADTSYTIELEENLPANSLVKILPVINKPKVSFPLSCEISGGNEASKFFVLTNEQRDCELRTRDPFLDYESKSKYSLTLKLNTIGTATSSSKTMALINVNILDKNDNKPMFQQVARYSHLTQGKFLAAIASDAPSESQLIQMKAIDLDSPQSNGLISYELLNEAAELESRFKINSIDGIIRSSKPMEDIPTTRLPLRLRVLARDNPEVASSSLESVAEILVNLIDDRHRIALVFKDTPTGRVLESKDELLSLIQERTGMVAGMEKAESLKVIRNNSLEPDVGGTDFWFYLIEPGSFRIVQSDDLRVKGSLFDYRGQNLLLEVINSSLNMTCSKVRMPYSITNGKTSGTMLTLSSLSRSFGANGQTFATFLILIALFIALTSTIVVIYQCGFWSSYSRASAAAAVVARNSAFQQMTNEKLYHPESAYFNQCPPPANLLNTFNSCSKNSFPYSPTDNQQQGYTYNRSGLSTFDQQIEPSLMPQLINQSSNRNADLSYLQTSDSNGIQANNNNNAPAALSKQYETQMLKMSVLFDDSNSIDEQNFNANLVSHNLQN